VGEKVKLLVQRGAKLHEKDNNGWNVVHLASNDGTLEAVKLFVEQY